MFAPHPKTVEEFNRLRPEQQGSLWPLCKTCKHIAQEHNADGCDAARYGQCPMCGNWTDHAQCDCKTYDGPKTVEELIAWLNSLTDPLDLYRQ